MSSHCCRYLLLSMNLNITVYERGSYTRLTGTYNVGGKKRIGGWKSLFLRAAITKMWEMIVTTMIGTEITDISNTNK